MAMIDLLVEIFIICSAVAIIGALVYGINRMVHKINWLNARLIWRVVARHRHV